MLNFFKRRKILKDANYLEMTPVSFLNYNKQANGNLELLIPKFKNLFFQQYLIPKNRSKHIRIKLDKFGSAVYLMIDGKNSVGDICKKIEKEQGEQIKDATIRITKFLTQLYDNRFISFKQLERAK